MVQLHQLHMQKTRYHWDSVFTQELNVTQKAQICSAQAILLHGILQMSLEPWVGIAQKHHVDQGLLRGLILYRELVLGIQVVVHRSEDFLRPMLPYQLHSMLEVVPRGKIHRRERPELSPTIAVVIEHLCECK